MSAEFLFDLERVECGYGNRTVLEIRELKLKKVPITFILGPSGIGKSTLLELIGLMSNTLISCNGKFQYSANSNIKVSFSDFWTWPEAKQSEFRKENFSFVFQQTNLMHNLNILENLCLPLLIQGYEFEKAVKIVTETAKNMGLSEHLLYRKTTEASGGQLQRIAFTRALSSDFNVLFGDEPTGNLDEKNATNLMKHLRDELIRKDAAAIIVSHDLKLAEEFSDCIIIIDKEIQADGFNGIIDKHSIRLR